MGVQTQISLEEINDIFPSYLFTSLEATVSGIIDTTYIVSNKDKSFILKKYERDIEHKIEQDIELLDSLKEAGLNVPVHLDSNRGWHLYKKLKGSQPQHIKSYHIQSLGRFLAKMHKQTSKTKCDSNIRVEMEVTEALVYAKANFYGYYKKFEFLKHFTHKNDARIIQKEA